MFNLGAIAYEGGNLASADLLYEEALAEARTIADGYGAARVLHALGIIQKNRGAAERALELFEESCTLKQRIGDLDGAANSAPGVSAGTLDVMAATACVALARGDAAGAAAGTAELAEQARSTGFVLWERAAQRIAAAASAARAGSGPPDRCRYPALIYVDRPIPANG